MTRFFILLTFLFLIVSACFCPPAPGTLQVAPTPPSGLTIAVGYYAVGITEEENVRRATRVAEIQALYLVVIVILSIFIITKIKNKP